MNILKGIRVVDLTMWAFVPAAGCVLAHWGADVIKVENPKSPDPMRLLGGTLEDGASSDLFKHYNRGKRAIGLNLMAPEGREVLYKLVDTADVFLTSYLPDTRRKLGIDLDDIRSRNPQIIYAKGSGQGPLGPESTRGGYDGATWWARGSLSYSAMQGSGSEWPPPMVGHGDGMSGLTLAGGICAGLLHRALTGVSTVVDGSLLGAAMWFNGPQIMNSKQGLGPARAAGRGAHEATGAVQSNQYRTKDGRWLSLHLLNDPDDLFNDMVAHLGRADLATDPRFSTKSARQQNNTELVHILDGVFGEKTLEEWKKILITTKGVWAPVQSAAEIHSDPQVVANRFIQEVSYPDGPISLVVPPILFDEDPGVVAPAPNFCEHTNEILSDIGFDSQALEKLRNAGAIG